MSQGRIVENLHHGLYKVRIIADFTQLKRMLIKIEGELYFLDYHIKEWEEKLSELDTRRDNVRDQLDLALEQYEGGYISEAALIQKLTAYAAATRDYWACERELGMKNRLHDSLCLKRLNYNRYLLLHGDNKHEVLMWCADYTTTLEEGTDVGIIHGTNELCSYSVIHPYNKQRYWKDLPTGTTETPQNLFSMRGLNSFYYPMRDGKIQPTFGAPAAQNFVNMALLPGVQRWTPFYRTGTITKIQLSRFYNVYAYYPVTATVELDTAISSAQSLDINPGQRTSNWIDYPGYLRLPHTPKSTIVSQGFDYWNPSDKRTSGGIYGIRAGLQFRPNDHIFLGFKNNSWNQGSVIGYTQSPRPAFFRVKIYRPAWMPWEAGVSSCKIEITDDAVFRFNGRKNGNLMLRFMNGKYQIHIGDIITSTSGGIATVTNVTIVYGDWKYGNAYGFLTLDKKTGIFKGPAIIDDPLDSINVEGKHCADYWGPYTHPIRMFYANIYEHVQASGVTYISHKWFNGVTQLYDHDNEYWEVRIPYFVDGGLFLIVEGIPHTIRTQYPNKYKTEDYWYQGTGPRKITHYWYEKPEDFIRAKTEEYSSGKKLDYGDRITDDMEKLYVVDMPYYDVHFRSFDPMPQHSENGYTYKRNPKDYTSYWLNPDGDFFVGTYPKDPELLEDDDTPTASFGDAWISKGASVSLVAHVVSSVELEMYYDYAFGPLRATKLHDFRNTTWVDENGEPVLFLFRQGAQDVYACGCYAPLCVLLDLHAGYYGDGANDIVVKAHGYSLPSTEEVTIMVAASGTGGTFPPDTSIELEDLCCTCPPNMGGYEFWWDLDDVSPATIRSRCLEYVLIDYYATDHNAYKYRHEDYDVQWIQAPTSLWNTFGTRYTAKGVFRASSYGEYVRDFQDHLYWRPWYPLAHDYQEIR